MKRSNLDSAEDARRFYEHIDDPTAASILDYLIDHPDERFEAADIMRQIGLDEHRDVARSTYRMGQIATELGLERPWTEGQLGYLMPGETAALLREARGSAVSDSR